MLVLDGSGSIIASAWTQVKQFSNSLVNAFQISPTGTRFGIVQFSSTSITRLELGLTAVKSTLNAKINGLVQQRGNTDIAKGIQLATAEFDKNARKGVQKVLILMTDGIQNQRGNPTTQAAAAKAKGIEIYTIGVSKSIDQKMLQTIASPPPATHCFNVQTFANLKDILSTLINRTCLHVLCNKIIPNHGPAKGGTTVKINGEGFPSTKQAVRCRFGTVVVSGTYDPAVGITCVSPPGTAGSSVTLEVSFGTDFTTDLCQFTYDSNTNEDPCAKWSDNCTFCISHTFCGWCSNPVIHPDGSRGAQCAGFNKNESSNEKPFICEGIYHTEECSAGYECNNKSATCELGKPGNGLPKNVCEQTCGLGNVYKCDDNNKTCLKCDRPTPDCKDYKSCSQLCYVAPPPSPDDVPIPGTPTQFIGIWRGFQINNGYQVGEWNIKFTPTTVTIKDSKGFITEGIVSKTTTQLWINVTRGNIVGKTIRAIYLENYIAVFKVVSIAFGVEGGPAPTSFEIPQRDPSYGSVFVWISCLNEAVCNFRWEDAMRILGKRSGVDDSCMQFKTCDVCIKQRLCGWCSTNVIYDDGTPGLQCAGFNPDSSKRPFQCRGTFSSDTCSFPPAPSQYFCDHDAKKCIETVQGNGSSLEFCQATCGKDVPPPSNNTPIALIGTWRALEVENGYPRGEFKFIFSKTSLLITKEDGETVIAGDIGSTEDQIWIYASTGIVIKAKWQIGYGPVTKLSGIAMGTNGGPAPRDFVAPISTPGMKEYFLISCLEEKKNICNFD